MEKNDNPDEFDGELDSKLMWAELESEFDFLNPNPEENSDFDSDNEINPLDSLTSNSYQKQGSGGLSSDNAMKKKPI